MARRRGETLLPVARRPTAFTDRILLAQELAGPRAAEITFALKVIDVGWVLHHTSLSPGRDMPAGGSWHMVWAKAGDHASRTKAANGRSVAVIRSPCPGRQSFAAGKPRIKIAFEACRRLGAFNHD